MSDIDRRTAPSPPAPPSPTEVQPPPSSRRWAWIVGVPLALLLGLTAYVLPPFVNMSWRAKRQEVPENVTSLITAERAYRASFDAYVAAERSPRLTPDKQMAKWVASEGFEALGWAPQGDVRGVYWVELRADGAGFTIHGRCDLDADGEVAEFIATEADEAARLITDPDVY